MRTGSPPIGHKLHVGELICCRWGPNGNNPGGQERGSSGLTGGATGGAVGGATYVAVFIAIASLTRRTAVWALAFVFLVERLLGSALTGIAQLSPTWESRAIFLGYLNDVPSRIVRTGIPQGGAAIVRLVIVTIVVLAVAIWRISHMRWAGASD